MLHSDKALPFLYLSLSLPLRIDFTVRRIIAITITIRYYTLIIGLWLFNHETMAEEKYHYVCILKYNIIPHTEQ